MRSTALREWAPKRTAVLPVSLYDGRAGQQFTGIYGYRVDRGSGIDLIGRLSDPVDKRYGYTPTITRSLVFGGRLVTVSDAGVGVASLTNFERSGYVAFPADPQATDPGAPRPAR